MKLKHILPLVAFSATTLSLTVFTTSQKSKIETYKKSHLFNSGGAGARNTGAPGESNCTACHSSNTNDGTAMNALTFTDAATNTVVTKYTPGTLYNVTLTMNSTAAKNGFQLVALQTSNNTQAGSVANVSGSTAVSNSQGRSYVNHTATSNKGKVFNFKWTAPATDVGDVKFYVASNVTNSNSSTNGDAIYLSQHVVSVQSSASVNQVEKQNLVVKYDSSKQTIQIKYNFTEDAIYSVNIVDMNGKSVLAKGIQPYEFNSELFLPKDLKAGVYIVNFFENNDAHSEKIYIQ
jgi:hypothetical protein